jgi:hypothetical protein
MDIGGVEFRPSAGVFAWTVNYHPQQQWLICDINDQPTVAVPAPGVGRPLPPSRNPPSAPDWPVEFADCRPLPDLVHGPGEYDAMFAHWTQLRK